MLSFAQFLRHITRLYTDHLIWTQPSFLLPWDSLQMQHMGPKLQVGNCDDCDMKEKTYGKKSTSNSGSLEYESLILR